MKIYKVRPDTRYRMMFPSDDVYESEDWSFHCEEVVEKIPQFNASWDEDDSLPKPDIAYLGMAAFAFKKETAQQLTEILERAGELLPFYVDDELWYFLNVTERLDKALDEENTTYKINQGNIRLIIEKHVFLPDNISNCSLFKIPQDNCTEVFCADRRDSDEQILENFYCAVQGNGFTGLEFIEVFSDE